MRAPDGRTDPGVIQRLLDEPQRFEFFQAVSLLLAWLGEHGVRPDRALAECLRFQNSLSMAFPPSQIEALRALADGRRANLAGMALAMRAQQDLRLQITPTFMGLLGAHGALPAHYTERISAWQAAEQDEAPRAFLDLLSNRMLALFFEAWRRHRVEQMAQPDGDTFQPLLLALAGFEHREHGPREEAISFHAGLLAQRPMSAVTLSLLLSGYLGVPVKVRETIGHWDPMTPQEQACLGVANATLGEDTMLGERGWRPDLRARLSLGPLSKDQFDRFLPSGEGAVALREMLCLFGEPTLVYEVELVLRAHEVCPVRLVGGQAPGSRLGRDSFMLGEAVTLDRADMRYDLRPMEPLQPLKPLPGCTRRTGRLR